MLRLLAVFRQSLEIILHPGTLHFTWILELRWEGISFNCETDLSLWMAENSFMIPIWSCIIIQWCLVLFWQGLPVCVCCLISWFVFAGRLHRFHGVRGRSQSGDARKDGAQAALVFQTLWCRRQRLHWQTWAPQHHKGTACHAPVALDFCNLAWTQQTDFIPSLQAIRAINGNENQEVSAEDFTNRVFDRIDINGDGEFVLAMNTQI